MDYQNEQVNSIIDRGLKIMAIMEQLRNVKKDSKNDEVRALAALIETFIETVRPVVLFKP